MMAEQVSRISGTTRVFGCIADPVGHVRAPTVFNTLFSQQDFDHVMVPIHAPADDLNTIIDGLRRLPNFGGMAVTIPHKVPIAALCDSLGAAAQLTGAVNAVRFDDKGRMHGDNFDGQGFVAGLRMKGHDPAGKSVLMIGAGGAARAIALALYDASARDITICNRTMEKAAAIADSVNGSDGAQIITAIENHDGSHVELIVNTTSLGLNADDILPLPLEPVSDGTLIADIIMTPAETNWLKAAQRRGLPIHHGHHMLNCQVELIGQFIGAL